MSTPTLQIDSLVLYKQRPARVTSLGDKKIEIQSEKGETISLRPKDVVLLHPGPLRNLRDLASGPAKSLSDELLTAWELLAGTQTTLPELAELAYEAYTPQNAWLIWQQLVDGLYFNGTPDEIRVHSAETVATIQSNRAAKAAEEQAWQNFLTHIRNGEVAANETRYLQDVVALALEQRDQSQVLRQLGRPETPQSAHALLLQCGYWTPHVNPYPQRLKQSTQSPQFALPPLPEEERRDLTHLLAFAIDDEGSQDPDDAISWVGDQETGEANGPKIWVHIADVAALIVPDSPTDLEARARSANLYLPEGTVHMLPSAAQDQLALGLSAVSPALSFLLELTPNGDAHLLDLTPSWVRVTRLSYAQAEEKIAEEPLRQLYALSQRFTAKRLANGAIDINLPEVKIRVKEGEVAIHSLPPLCSRDLVRDAMLMTGEAVAHYAIAHDLALPFSTQDANPEAEGLPRQTLSEMFALRRLLKPSRQQTEAAPHAGLGLPVYVQTTSPLRRYSDLLTHQQLRAHLRNDVTLSAGQLNERLVEAGENSRTIRQCERISNQHWTLVYLLEHPDWQGEGIVIERMGNRALILIPTLALECELYGQPDLVLDDTVSLAKPEVNLPELTVHFRRIAKVKTR
ncbi:MAG: RNB domain-containing ribonuclease [Caldilineaceae bacterium]